VHLEERKAAVQWGFDLTAIVVTQICGIHIDSLYDISHKSFLDTAMLAMTA
jgi:hypothetical protein